MRHTPRLARLAAASTLALLLAAPAARAGNEAHPRTPVLWPDASCGWVVDRSATSTIELAYAIPFEDTMLGPDELPDSRTHQFFALCRQRDPGELLPNWITRDDVERAGAAGLVDAASVGAEQVLDEAAAWAGCFERITADDARRPITFDAAALPVAWSLVDVPRGVYEIAGYTFEPPFNLWQARRGFVKILDDPSDPSQDVPAAAIATTDAIWSGAGTIELCVDAIPPIEASVEWAVFAPQLDYQQLDVRTIAAPGTIVLDVAGPSVDEPVEGVLRVRIVDSLGREFVAHHGSTLIFEPGPEPAPDTEESSSGPALDSSSGCSCGQASAPGSAGLALLALAFVLARLRTHAYSNFERRFW